MKYIEALEYWVANPEIGCERRIFMAGGITNCPDWQQEMVKMLEDTDLVLLNPRRKNFPIHDPDASRQQITWEFDHFKWSDMMMFWFPKETMCPIVLFELGRWSAATHIPIFVGMDPEYQRRQDVEIQMELIRPGFKISYSLKDLANSIRRYIGCAEL